MIVPSLLLIQFAQAGGGTLRSGIALWFAEHLKAHHKFSDRGRSQQWWIEVRVEMPLGMRRVVGGSRVKAHRVRKWNLEDTIVGAGYGVKDLSKLRVLMGTQV